MHLIPHLSHLIDFLVFHMDISDSHLMQIGTGLHSDLMTHQNSILDSDLVSDLK